MDKIEEIREISDGKYSFYIGVHQYTLTTPIPKDRFLRIVSRVQDLVDSFPPQMSQDERLLMALLTVANQMDKVFESISDLAEKIHLEKE
jgi:hypothetical protein